MTGGGRRVLVTGASGFVGRHTLRPLLSRGFEVHAVARGAAVPEAAGCSWHRADLLDVEQRGSLMRRVAPTHLLHAAWYAIPKKYWTAPENGDWLQASLELLSLFRAQGGSRVLGAGTCAEYDWTEGGVCKESDLLSPATPYGQAKAALQLALAASGLDQAWGRVFFPFGPHEPPARFIPSVIRALLAGEPANLSHGNQVRDFLFIEDLGDAFAALLDSPVQGAVNLGSGEGVRLREAAERIQSRLGGELRFGALEAPAGEPEALVAAVGRLGGEVGWRPRTSLDSGLDRAIQWWNDHLQDSPGA